MALSTLDNIRTKVRRITRSPSDSQITDAQIDDYINTFVLYDFPEHLRLFNLTTNLTFYTEPNVAIYDTNTTVSSDPLYDFKNKYISLHPPAYVGGIEVRLTQSQNEFFQFYPKNMFIQQVGSGDGVTTTFTGIVPSFPFEQNDVMFTSIDANNNGLVLVDYPVSSELGALGIPDTPQTIPSPYGQINYLTGAFTVNFPTAPAQGTLINSQTFPYAASKPNIILFFDTKFQMRPIPDQVYKVELQAFIRPTELLSDSQTPELQEWFQYIAYGASKKVFEDRMDLESVQLIMPEFKQQERLCLRRTLVQQSNNRVSTIYTQGAQMNNGGFGWFSGSGSF